MPANTTPIFTNVPILDGVQLTAANTKSDGTGTIGTDIFLLTTAGANGAWIGRIQFSASASVASTGTTATIARVFVSSVSSGATTAANTWMIREVILPAVTAAHPTIPTPPIDFPAVAMWRGL